MLTFDIQVLGFFFVCFFLFFKLCCNYSLSVQFNIDRRWWNEQIGFHHIVTFPGPCEAHATYRPSQSLDGNTSAQSPLDFTERLIASFQAHFTGCTVCKGRL